MQTDSNGNPISYHDPFGLARETLSNTISSVTSMLHTGLDLAGMVPGFGMVPDAINTTLYLAKGDYTNMALSSMAIIPFVGDAATGAKYVGKYADDVAELGVKGYNKVKGISKKSEFTKDVLKNKPKYSPTPNKWFDKGGDIHVDADNVWSYTDWDGNTVRYKKGYPDFKEAGYVHQEVTLDGFTSSRSKDFRKADAMATPPKKGTWHHHEDGTTMQDVDFTVHDRFKHIGGFSKTNTKK